MIEPEQFAIWIGPAQQTGQPCSLLWPIVQEAQCSMSGYQTWSNVTLRNIRVQNPLSSPGVLLGNTTNPIGVSFENVVFTDMRNDLKPWGQQYYCDEGGFIINSVSDGTYPKPECYM